MAYNFVGPEISVAMIDNIFVDLINCDDGPDTGPDAGAADTANCQALACENEFGKLEKMGPVWSNKMIPSIFSIFRRQLWIHQRGNRQSRCTSRVLQRRYRLRGCRGTIQQSVDWCER